MHWYEGGIADAVSLSRKNGSIFVVYIEGKDDESTELTNAINKEEVTKELGSNHFVAIKIEANSVPHQQFSEIYKGAKVPSVYFIGKNGAPLDIIENITDSTEFVQKIQNILIKSGISVAVSTSQAQSSNLIKEEQKEEVCENIVPTLEANEAVAGPSLTIATDKNEVTESSLTTDQKLEMAKEQMEKNREAKRREEEEKERAKEIERRKMGQDAQKMKRWQQDQELKQLLDAREKEKKEQQAAKQRILEQIKQDRVDRAARFSNTPQPTQPSPQSTNPPVPRVLGNGMTRIQFKLPDGSAHTHEFKADSTLDEVKGYIKTNLNLSFNFMLATTFPRREFTNEHDMNTLSELELVPSAVLLILPVSHGTVSSNNRTFTSFLWSFIAPILNVLSYFKNIVFGPSTPTSTPQDNNKRPAEPSGESSRPFPKKRAAETTVIRRQGNVHRLSDKTDSDDDTNTWNGNSTQQM